MALKNELNSSFESGFSSKSSVTNVQSSAEATSATGNWLKGFLFVAFLLSFFLFLFSQISSDSINSGSSSATVVFSKMNGNAKLLQDMGQWMERMGYGQLSKEQLVDLRNKGVTATFTSKIKDLGYNPTLDELILLQKHDVSATFASMMHSLGYTSLSLDDLIKLRTHGVTAHYTSNLHDLGYVEITPDELIRLKDAKVSISMVKKLNKDRLQPASVEELVRYGISNQ